MFQNWLKIRNTNNEESVKSELKNSPTDRLVENPKEILKNKIINKMNNSIDYSDLNLEGLC